MLVVADVITMKVGTKVIPENRLPSLIEAVKTLYGKFSSNEIDDETASRILGHTTSRSGAYIQKKADLRSFGLIEPRGAVKVTEIGRKVSYPDDVSEEQDGLINAISNIELWKLIYEKYTKKGLTLPSDFWTDIRVWTEIPPEEAQKSAEILRKAYLEDIKYIKPEFELKKEEVKLERKKVDISEAISLSPLDEQAKLVGGLIKFGAYDIAKQFIDFIKEKESKKEEPKEAKK